jgi:hypothetical protein
MGSEIWQSGDFCFACGVGRQNYCGVKIDRDTRRIGKEGPTHFRTANPKGSAFPEKDRVKSFYGAKNAPRAYATCSLVSLKGLKDGEPS